MNYTECMQTAYRRTALLDLMPAVFLYPLEQYALSFTGNFACCNQTEGCMRTSLYNAGADTEPCFAQDTLHAARREGNR